MSKFSWRPLKIISFEQKEFLSILLPKLIYSFIVHSQLNDSTFSECSYKFYAKNDLFKMNCHLKCNVVKVNKIGYMT